MLGLDIILAKVRQNDLEKFSEKIHAQEEAVEKSLKERGLKNISNLVEEAQQQTNLKYEEMVSGPESLLYPGETAKETENENVSDEKLFDRFLQQLK